MITCYISDIEEKLEYFNDLITFLFDIHAPLKTRKFSKPPAPWLTDTVKIMMQKRDVALQRYKRTYNPIDYQKFKDFKNITNKAIENEQKAYFNHKFSSNQSKTL